MSYAAQSKLKSGLEGAIGRLDEDGAQPAARPPGQNESHVDLSRLSTSALTFALKSSEARRRALEDTPLQGLFVHYRFRPLYANAACASMFGLDREIDILDRSGLLELFDEDAQADPEALWARMISGPALRMRRTFRRVDGGRFRAEMFARPVIWDERLAVAVALIDVTREERAALEARDAFARAEVAVRNRRAMITSISHDLRTPLHAVMGCLQLALQQRQPTREDVLAALESCEAMTHRLDDLADAAELEDDRAPPMQARVALAALASHALTVSRVRRPEFDGEISAVVDPQDWVLGDERRLRRLFVELAHAALLRFPSGAVALYAQADEAGAVIIVTATGPADAPKLDSDGIAAARAAASALGGVVAQQEQAGQRWVLTCFVPARRIEPPPADAAKRAMEVLVLEDNPTNRRLIDLVLRSLGHCPTITTNGADGLAAAAARRFDLVLMDIAMPGMDGLETARRMRGLRTPWPQPPIVALTASVGEGAVAAAADAGMDAFLTKPLSIRRLAETIALLAECSVGPAELDRVQGEDDGHEAKDDEKGGQATLHEDRTRAIADDEGWS